MKKQYDALYVGSVGKALRDFAGIDIADSAMAELLSGIAIKMCHLKRFIPSKFVISKEGDTTILAVKGTEFAKFEGKHIVEIMVPYDPYEYKTKRWDYFQLAFNKQDIEYLRKASFPGYKEFGKGILQYAFDLKTLDIPDLEYAGDNFLKFSQIKTLNAPKLQTVGDYFLYHNEELVNLNAPNLETIGKNGLYTNDRIKKLDLPQLREVGDNFLYANSRLDDRLTKLPKIKKAGRDCQPLINELVIYNKMKHR